MKMFRTKTTNPPHSKLVREQKGTEGCVRVYTQNFETLFLQLWCPTGRYTGVSLTPTEARAIAEQMIATANELEADNVVET